MEYNSIYNSPLGRILITEQNGKLTGLKFLKEPLNTKTNITPVIKKTIEWLDAYFNGENQDTLSNLTPEYSLEGSEFQKKVWKEISLIPRGKTKLMAGDRLTVMTDERDAGYIHDKLENLCYTSF